MPSNRAFAFIAAMLSCVQAQTTVPQDVPAGISSSGLVTVSGQFQNFPGTDLWDTYNLDTFSTTDMLFVTECT